MRAIVTSNGSPGGVYGLEIQGPGVAAVQMTRLIAGYHSLFFTMSSDRELLFLAHSAQVDDEENPEDMISIFLSDRDWRHWVLRDKVSTQGTIACYLDFNERHNLLLMANYGSGSFCAAHVNKDGAVINARRFSIAPPAPSRSELHTNSHPHFLACTPCGNFAIGLDLGFDCVLLYSIEEMSTLLPIQVRQVQVAHGSGPRHLVFHPQLPVFYVIYELSNEIAVFKLDSAPADMAWMQKCSTLPAGTSLKNAAADLAISRSGRFLYCSNRGHDSLAIFRIRPDGLLEEMDFVSSCGKDPLSLAMSPCGEILLCANHSDSTLAFFQVSSDTGGLHCVRTMEEISQPTRVEFL